MYLNLSRKKRVNSIALTIAVKHCKRQRIFCPQKTIIKALLYHEIWIPKTIKEEIGDKKSPYKVGKGHKEKC